MKALLCTFIALHVLFITYAQSNYQKATIITRDAEKLQGWVNYKEWERSPSVVSFKTDLKRSEVKKYQAKEINYLEVENKEYYERFPVSISMDLREPISQLSYGPNNKVVDDTVLLKIIQKGNVVDLYSYRDNIKTRYYLKEKGKGNLVELVYKKYMHPEERTKQVTVETFKNQLVEAAKNSVTNTSQLLELLQATGYNEQDISRVTDLINGGNSQYFPLHKPSATRFYAGLALSSSQAFYDGDHVLAKDASYKTSYFPKVAVGLDLLNQPLIGRLLFRFEFSFTGASHEISKVTEGKGKTTHKFNQYTESFSPLVIYNIYNGDRLKFNAGAGLGLNLSQYSNNKKQIDDFIHPDWGRTEDVQLRNFWITVPVRLGAIFKKKYEVYGQYNYSAISITDYMEYSISVRTWQVGFNYLF